MVVLYAVIDADRHGDCPLAHKLLKINCPSSLPGFEGVNFVNHISLFCIEAFILTVLIGVGLICSETILGCIVEGELTADSQTAEIRQKVEV